MNGVGTIEAFDVDENVVGVGVGTIEAFDIDENVCEYDLQWFSYPTSGMKVNDYSFALFTYFISKVWYFSLFLSHFDATRY